MRRDRLNPLLQAFASEVELDGDLAYCIFRLMNDYCHERNYSSLASVVGVCRLTADEFVRRVVTPYENDKIRMNGDVLDDPRLPVVMVTEQRSPA